MRPRLVLTRWWAIVPLLGGLGLLLDRPRPLPRHRAEWLAVDGVRLRTVRAGSGETTLVLLHGYGESLTTWRSVFDRLAERHRVVALDLPGFGSSSKPAIAPYTVRWFAESVRETLRLPEPEETERLLAEMEPGAHGLTFLPLLAGERGPGWADEANGTVAGLSMSSTPVEILRAAMEAVAFRFALIAEIIEEASPGEKEVIATGGGVTDNIEYAWPGSAPGSSAVRYWITWAPAIGWSATSIVPSASIATPPRVGMRNCAPPTLSETALAMISQFRGATLSRCRAHTRLGSKAMTFLERRASTAVNRPSSGRMSRSSVLASLRSI